LVLNGISSINIGVDISIDIGIDSISIGISIGIGGIEGNIFFNQYG